MILSVHGSRRTYGVRSSPGSFCIEMDAYNPKQIHTRIDPIRIHQEFCLPYLEAASRHTSGISQSHRRGTTRVESEYTRADWPKGPLSEISSRAIYMATHSMTERYQRLSFILSSKTTRACHVEPQRRPHYPLSPTLEEQTLLRVYLSTPTGLFMSITSRHVPFSSSKKAGLGSTTTAERRSKSS